MKYQSLNSVGPRISRKSIRSTSKRSPENRRPEESDLSNDSGLGLDHQLEVRLATRTALPLTPSKTWSDYEADTKRRRLTFQCEPEEVNDEFCFPDLLRRVVMREGCRNLRSPSPKENMPARGRATGITTLSSPLNQTSRDGKNQLVIVCQPEQQHRARYQTEGSRGAVKDRTGNGFPVVKLVGYTRPTSLQVFIGTDVGRVTPHMFYQACRVSGKNSTPCIERKVEGTVIIEIDLDPSKDMVVTCDCVGILKERNVDVEHRFPEQTGSRNKKKSTRCRIVFRTTVINSDGSSEVLQVCSQPIVCTQPPGIPEICKKSLSSCPVTGGSELFILGKNFLKDTRVVFQQTEVHPQWEESVVPDKEFLQQTHLVCVVPPYQTLDITEPVTVKVFVTSSGKASDPHTLVYLPTGGPLVSAASECAVSHPAFSQAFVNGTQVFGKSTSVASSTAPPLTQPHGTKHSYLAAVKRDVHSISMAWQTAATMTKIEVMEEEERMMPPPPALIPISRRPSAHALKTELVEELSQSSLMETDESSSSPKDLSMKAQLFEIPNSVEKYFAKDKAYSVYETQQREYLEEAVLQPKLQLRNYPEGVYQDESSRSSYEGVRQTRSGSFSGNPPDHGFVSSSALPPPPHTHYEHASSFETGSPVMSMYTGQVPVVLASECPDKSLSTTLPPVRTSPVRDLEPVFYCQPDTVQTTTSATTNLDCQDIITSTRNLDAFVNSAAESHISPKRDAYNPSFSTFELLTPQIRQTPSTSAEATIPTTQLPVNTICAAQKIGDMVLPPGPAPPLSGMVPQEMVKMTDNDLISYINPSCFDQV